MSIKAEKPEKRGLIEELSYTTFNRYIKEPLSTHQTNFYGDAIEVIIREIVNGFRSINGIKYLQKNFSGKNAVEIYSSDRFHTDVGLPMTKQSFKAVLILKNKMRLSSDSPLTINSNQVVDFLKFICPCFPIC